MTEVDTTDIERQVELAVREAGDLAIKDDEGLCIAGAWLVGIKTILKRIDETFAKSIASAYATHKTLLAEKKKCSDPLTRQELVLKRGMSTYQAEQRAIEEERQQRLREVARKKEEDRVLAEAQELEASGQKKEAEALIEEPVYVPPVAPAKEMKVAGVSTRTAWKWRMKNIALLPNEYKMVDEKALNKVVSALGANCKIPGIEVYPKEIVSARSN